MGPSGLLGGIFGNFYDFLSFWEVLGRFGGSEGSGSGSGDHSEIFVVANLRKSFRNFRKTFKFFQSKKKALVPVHCARDARA